MARSKNQSPPVLITGDVCLETFEYLDVPIQTTSPAYAALLNHDKYPAVRRYPARGGAWQVQRVLSHLQNGLSIDSPGIDPQAGDSPLLTREYAAKKAGRYWIDQFKGYRLPADNTGFVRYPKSAKGKRLAICYDEGNDFRAHAGWFPQELDPDCLFLFKMNGPVSPNPLWETISNHPAIRPEKRVVIISAGELRKEEEISISQAISWEATARDLAFYLVQGLPLASLFYCQHLIVLLGSEGAFYFQNRFGVRQTLFFDPGLLEGQFGKQLPGMVSGRNAVFTAVLADHILREDPRLQSLDKGIVKGLQAMRQWQETGYEVRQGEWGVPLEALDFTQGRTRFSAIPVPHPRSLFEPDPAFWTILDEKVKNSRRLVAEHVVRFGYDPLLKEAPEIRFGKVLKAMDRAEIERLSGIWRLIAEYLESPVANKPLSLAVFGAPGSGKSFSINQVAEQVDARRIQKMTFNLSQFRDYKELAAAFHKIRNYNLAGKVPLVFFDEFDSNQLEWLKFFLAPMQDGEFLDGEAVYNLGNAIFVFAGGTCTSFEQFSQVMKSGSREEQEVARHQKLPDFISRLRGFINIKGPNPVDDRIFHDDLREETIHWKDHNYLIRRAMLIRSIFERASNAPHLFDPLHGELHIDSGVLRALLLVPEYKHGIRSMEALIGMSRLSGKQFFDKAALPPDDQLDLHVDKDIFKFLLEKERFGMPSDYPQDFIARENEIVRQIARGIHQEYLRNRHAKGEPVNVTADFDTLKKDHFSLYLSNVHAAREIPEKLKSIGIGIRPLREGGQDIRFPVLSQAEMERLAAWEHQRWFQERKWASESAPELASNPYLEPWDKLPEAVKERDFEMIHAIPFLLERQGLAPYRMEEVAAIDERMIASIAKAIHSHYVAERLQEGAKPGEQEHLVPFDQLSDAIRQVNLDHARHIPTNLEQIGYGIRLILPAEEIKQPAFSKQELESLAEWEHQRWCWEKWRHGYIWKAGKQDNTALTHPDLRPYAQLPESVKDKDRQLVCRIPELLQEAGYALYKL